MWSSDVAARLAEELMEEDLAVSVRMDELGPPAVEDGAQALWLMAANICRISRPNG